ncbi:hypothetical protein BS78_04G265700 [Paspalum vaginatum]|nr:hypothetical protein BS78_04G265700 [Paspalum vaginatum]
MSAGILSKGAFGEPVSDRDHEIYRTSICLSVTASFLAFFYSCESADIFIDTWC